MIRTQFAALALGLFIASPAVAQTSLAGDWDVTINSPQGANTSKVTFKQDANKLDGMIKSPAGETPIGGTVEGEDVKVAFTINFQGMPFEIKLNGKLAGDTIQEQARQALTNCEAILRAADAGPDAVVEVGILLTRSDDFEGLNDEYARWFASDSPARYVAKLGVDLPGLPVSIRMTAIVS